MVSGSMKPRLPVPDSQTQSRPACQRGEWGIDRPRTSDLAAGHVDQNAAAALLARQPASGVGVPERRDVARPAVDHRQAVQMAAVLGPSAEMNGGRQRGTKLYDPVERTEAREPRVDEPEFIAPPGHLVDLDVAGDMARRGMKQASCMPVGSSLAVTAGML